MILDDEATTEIALNIKKRLRQIKQNSTGDRAPHLLQNLHGEFYEELHVFLKAAVTEFAKSANEHDRHDLCQDSFLKILRSIESFKQKRGKIHSWMTMIVKNLCIDWARKKRPELGIPDEVKKETRPLTHQGLDPEAFDTLKAFFPFFASDKLIFELLAIVEKYQYKASLHCVSNIIELLNKHGIDSTEYGKPVELTQAIIIALRGLLLTPMTDRTEIIEDNLRHNSRLDVMKILTFFMGPRQASQLILLMGGMTIQLPSPQQFFKVGNHTR